MKTVKSRFLCGLSALLLACSISMQPAILNADEAFSGNQVYGMSLAAMRHVSMPKSLTYQLSYRVHNILLDLACAQDASHKFLGSSVSIAKNDRSNTGQVVYDSTSGLGVLSVQGKPYLTCAPFPFAPEIRALVRTGADLDAAPTLAAPSPGSDASNGPLDVIKSIGSVRTFSSKAYLVENIGTEDIDGNTSFHLRLTPFDGNQDAHPVTDVFVDTKSLLMHSVTLGGGKRGFFRGGGGSARFDFSSVGKLWLVTRISIAVSGHLLLLHEDGTLEYTLHDFSFNSDPTS